MDFGTDIILKNLNSSALNGKVELRMYSFKMETILYLLRQIVFADGKNKFSFNYFKI